MRWLTLTGVVCAALSAGCADGEPLSAGGGTGAGSTGTGTSTVPSGPKPVPGSACPHTTDRFSFRIDWGGGQTLACGEGTGTVVRSAVVAKADTATAELVDCPPGAGCIEDFQLGVVAPDLAMPLIVGAFVRIEASMIQTGDGCAMSLIVANLPELYGQPNPITPAPILWLAGADGTLLTAPDAPFHVSDAPGCGADSHPGFADDEIAFGFSEAPGEAPATLSLPMGASYVAMVPGDAWLLRNLRSYHAAGGPLGDQRDFAYWITHVMPALP